MFRVINGCKRVLKIGNTLINYKKYADFDDSYSYELEKFKELIRTGLVKVIYNLNETKTTGYKLEKKKIPNPELEITEKDPKSENSVEKIEEVVEETEVSETKPKSNKRKKKSSEDEENNENN